MTTMTVVLVGAITLAVGASLVEAGLRAWRGSARRKRRERKARGSQDNLEVTPPPSPPPLSVNTRAHQARTRQRRLQRIALGAYRRASPRNAATLSAAKPSLIHAGADRRAPPAQPRGLPEGEYYRSPRRSRDGSYAPGSPAGSVPASPERPWRPAPPELRQLPSIPSAQDLTLPEGADAWAAAVSAKEPWTQVEPWRTLWAASADAEKAEKAEATKAAAEASAAAAAAAKAAREAAEEARWSAVAARQEAARNADPSGRDSSPPRAGWAADGKFDGGAGAGAAQTSAELADIERWGAQTAAAERNARERLEYEHSERVRALMGTRNEGRF